MKVAFHTLGCKVNQDDTQGLAQAFLDRGYQVVPFQKGADIYVINTCSVTAVGEQKSRQMIHKAYTYNPAAVIVVTGCYAQTSPQVIAGIPGVNLVIGMADRPRIVELVEDFQYNRQNRQVVADVARLQNWVDLPTPNSSGNGGFQRTRASLKIEEGCEQYCSYCIVPYARGKVRSMPPQQVMQAFRGLLSQGYREIVLTGIHLGAYGKDLNLGLADLLRDLLNVSGDFRIRLGSIEPLDLNDHLLATIVGQPKICQYLHIPLQSGCDKILTMMNRGYNQEYIIAKWTEIREKNPLIAIGTDLIVGFPGETEADFRETFSLLETLRLARIHVFRFSPRRGTPAAEFPDQVPEAEKLNRSKIIQEIARRSAGEYTAQFVGKEVAVLFEEPVPGGWAGLSGEYLPVRVETERNLKNHLLNLLISSYRDDCLWVKDCSHQVL